MTFRQNRIGRSLDAYRDATGARARKVIVEELTRGFKAGSGPDVVARRIRKRVRDVAVGRAMTIARTELMTAIWTQTQREFARDPVVSDWQWMATLDGRTCVICRAMHGRRFPKTDRLRSHPNCRCAMVPVVAGQPAIPERDSGEAAFRRLSAREQRRILGDGRLAAYRESGSLAAMTEVTSHPIYGPGRAIIPLRRLLRRAVA